MGLRIRWLYSLLRGKTPTKKWCPDSFNCFWRRGSRYRDLRSLEYPFIVWQYLLGSCLWVKWILFDVCKKKKTLKKNSHSKNINLSVQWTRFPNLSAKNNARWVEMKLKSLKSKYLASCFSGFFGKKFNKKIIPFFSVLFPSEFFRETISLGFLIIGIKKKNHHTKRWVQRRL